MGYATASTCAKVSRRKCELQRGIRYEEECLLSPRYFTSQKIVTLSVFRPINACFQQQQHPPARLPTAATHRRSDCIRTTPPPDDPPPASSTILPNFLPLDTGQSPHESSRHIPQPAVPHARHHHPHSRSPTVCMHACMQIRARRSGTRRILAPANSSVRPGSGPEGLEPGNRSKGWRSRPGARGPGPGRPRPRAQSRRSR
ncbi:hypothetical protein GGR56DRAFT_493419 [Xylariaceae sp. FL0804]|nr:hypothetical protein GGR56DRAFT_493419 [Xylariaceae sp. FL0804]